MGSKAIVRAGVRRCVIGVPSAAIQAQWRATLIVEGWSESELWGVGGGSTCDLPAVFARDRYCVIVLYASSHLLVEHMTDRVELLVLDEAHHMAGRVAEESGEGRTRRLMWRACELGVKRLSLTYTPRWILGAGGGAGAFEDEKVMSMDDARLFGPVIAELGIRPLIEAGVLPDYRLWMLREGAGSKAAAILDAWEATEIVRHEERHILHHLIVFAPTTEEAKAFEAFFRAHTRDLVLRVGEGDALAGPLAAFEAARRAILVNCFVLGEGVDVPVANAVAITYPKQSRGQITQMVLRAGRAYPGKSVFHVLLPAFDEDLSGVEEVLTALASADGQLRDEIVWRAAPAPVTAATATVTTPATVAASQGTECIVWESFESNVEEIRRCFEGVRQRLAAGRLQALCRSRGVDTSLDYARLREEWPDLPEDPRPRGVGWYDWLHEPRSEVRMTVEAFAATVWSAGIRTAEAYEAWLSSASGFPSLQNISDGYFGACTNFNALIGSVGSVGSVEREGRR